jgi:hypothetical protein
MAPNEQDRAATQAPPKGWLVLEGRAGVWKHEAEEKKLGTLTAVEKIVNEYAKKFAKKHRVGENNFSISLVTKFKGVMGLKRGPVVQIILLWPDAQPNINTLLDGAFRTISRNRLVDGFALEPVYHVRKRAEDRKRMLREKIGADEADIILDLIPKHRIKCTVTTVVEYEDVVTGEKLSVTHTEKPEQFRGQDVSNWLKLSRIVRDNHPEEATRYADAVDEGSELLTALADERSNPESAGADVVDGTDAERSGSDTSGEGVDGEEYDAARPHQIAG